MAAFPPPVLDLHIPRPLRELFRACEVNCVTGCCGIDAFDISAEHLVKELVDLSPEEFIERARQLEALLNSIARHCGSIHADELNGLFNQIWQTPYDCLTYFKTWRTEIAVAVSQLSTPVFFDPLWLTGDVIALRDAIEAQRAFDRLPILADALEEAGCENQSILGHLRDPGDHAHHCWVIDLLSCGSATPSK